MVHRGIFQKESMCGGSKKILSTLFKISGHALAVKGLWCKWCTTNYKKKTLQCSNGLNQSLTQQPNIADVANFVQLGKCKVKFKASVYMLVNCGDQ